MEEGDLLGRGNGEALGNDSPDDLHIRKALEAADDRFIKSFFAKRRRIMLLAVEFRRYSGKRVVQKEGPVERVELQILREECGAKTSPNPALNKIALEAE